MGFNSWFKGLILHIIFTAEFRISGSVRTFNIVWKLQNFFLGVGERKGNRPKFKNHGSKIEIIEKADIKTVF